MEEKTLTYGEKAVGITFNPSQMGEVNTVKQSFANVIDVLNDIVVAGNLDGEQVRLFKIAITEAQGAQMWAVKALTSRV